MFSPHNNPEVFKTIFDQNIGCEQYEKTLRGVWELLFSFKYLTPATESIKPEYEKILDLVQTDEAWENIKKGYLENDPEAYSLAHAISLLQNFDVLYANIFDQMRLLDNLKKDIVNTASGYMKMGYKPDIKTLEQYLTTVKHYETHGDFSFMELDPLAVPFHIHSYRIEEKEVCRFQGVFYLPNEEGREQFFVCAPLEVLKLAKSYSVDDFVWTIYFDLDKVSK